MRPSLVAVDVETGGLDPRRDPLHGFSVAYRAEDGAIRARYFEADAVPDSVRELLADPSVEKVGHRLRFDLKFLRTNGFDVRGRWYCTKILAHLLDENSKTGLKDLASRLLKEGSLSDKRALDEACAAVGAKHVGELVRTDLEYQKPRPFSATIARYCEEDSRNTLELFSILGAKLRDLDAKVKTAFSCSKGPLDYYLEESLPAEAALLELELEGIRINREAVESWRQDLRLRLLKLEAELRDLASAALVEVEERLFVGACSKFKSAARRARVRRETADDGTRFNWNSVPHLQRLLFAGAKRSTDEASLRALPASPLVDKLLEFRGCQKLLGTYAEGLLERAVGDRIFAEYTPFTATGRLASEKPNMQNLPRGCPVKRAFTPDRPAEQVFIYADYSQIELRIAAHLSQDPVMLESYRLDEDLHVKTAAKAFGVAVAQISKQQRQAGKTTNFLLIFDGGPTRLQEQLASVGLDFSLDECAAFRDAYFETFPRYREYLTEQLAAVSQKGGLVSAAGRLRRLPEIALGAWLERRSRRFTGPRELRETLVAYPGEKLSDREIYERASKRYAHAKKQAYNFPIQSLAASITKAAVCELRRKGFSVRSTVHDSIVVQVSKESALAAAESIRSVMENAYQLSVPLKVDVKILNSLDESDVFVVENLQKSA